LKNATNMADIHAPGPLLFIKPGYPNCRDQILEPPKNPKVSWLVSTPSVRNSSLRQIADYC
jgi:hypothetical protein